MQAGHGPPAVDQVRAGAPGLGLWRLACGIEPVDARAPPPHRLQRGAQHLGFVGVKAIGKNPHPRGGAQQAPRWAGGKVLQALAYAGAGAKAGGDGVDFFLHARAVAVHQRAHIGQAGVEDVHLGVSLAGKGAGHTQKERAVGLHGAAHVDQQKQAGGLGAACLPRRHQGIAVVRRKLAQQLAHIGPRASRGMLPAAQPAPRQLAMDLACQAHQRAQLLRPPQLALGSVQRIGAAGAAHGLGTAGAVLRQDLIGAVAGAATGGLGRGGRACIHGRVQVLHGLAQITPRPRLAADLDGAAQALWMKKLLEQSGPLAPLLHAVAGHGAPGGRQRRLALKVQGQCALEHGLLLAHPHGKTVRAQKSRKLGQPLQHGLASMRGQLGHGLRRPRPWACRPPHPAGRGRPVAAGAPHRVGSGLRGF